jgi:transketolase
MAFDEGAVRQAAAAIRCDILRMIALAKSGHPGGSLSAADILALLYNGGVLRHRPQDPNWPGRDRFILSKGHAAPVLYATLAQAGYFDKGELATLRRLGSRLQGHPDYRKLPGVEASTGSLGQGLSIAAGMALGLASEDVSRRVYVLLGDGELQEGQVWEAAMFAAHRGLSNLIAIVDANGLQIDGPTDEVLSLGDVGAKFAAFGWAVHELDGHDILALKEAFDTIIASAKGPSVIIARTVKGKGVDFMEGECGWHGKAPTDEQCAGALETLELSATEGGQP